MKQYWTPLARWLGMAKTDEAPAIVAPADVGSRAEPPAVHSPWPDLFQALRRQALTDWVPRSQRHAEIDPQQRLEITHLQIRATSPEYDRQLREWFSEGDTSQLIRWIARGPWRTAAIERWVSWAGLTQLELLPMALPERPSASPYDVDASVAQASQSPYEIEAQTCWSAWTAPSEEAQQWPPLALHIEDALGQRSVQVMQTLVVLGTEKTLKTADGERLVLKDQSPVLWEGETAWFVAVTAEPVSGLPLMLRRHERGVECVDAGSTNGTFVQGQRLEPGHWHPLAHLQTLFLGGPSNDPRTHTARIAVQVGHPAQALARDRTPLRVSAPPAADRSALLMLRPLSGPVTAPVAVHALPFTVGRDEACDWVIPASCQMVSRQHLVIDAVDVHKRCVQLRDLSRQGLTHSRAGWPGPATDGVWVDGSDVITLGATTRHEGLSFGFEWAPL